MGKFIDLTGKTFGRLTVIERFGYQGTTITWKCQCLCGNVCVKRGDKLKNGETRSCGCYNHDRIMERNTKHGKSKSKLHKKWESIKERCYNKNHKYYYLYGGRGIAVCPEWLDKENGFINFYNWAMPNGYKEGLTIDRINSNGNYEPSNCRWATLQEQGNNKRNNQRYSINGESLTIAELSRKYNIKYGKLRDRLKVLNWDIQKALNTP